jgi:hypothetical protein
MDNIRAKPCAQHKKQGKYMISECDIYKAAADTRDYGWVREIVLFDLKDLKRKRLQDIKRDEEEEKEKESKRNKEEAKQYINSKEKQVPAPGTHRRTQVTNLTYVSTVVPIIKDGRDLHSLQAGGNDNIWKYCKTAKMGKTIIPIKNYVGHLNDREYIKVQNDVLRGKLYEWRLNSCKYLNDLTNLFERPKKATEDQLSFAKHDVLQILKGIEKFNVMCISLMSLSAMMTYIDGINDIEHAHLVYEIANCEKFRLGVVTHDREFNVTVITIFNEDEENKYGYGKNEIEDLHYIHHERDNEKHRKLMEIEKAKSEEKESSTVTLRTVIANPYVTPQKKDCNDIVTTDNDDKRV